MTVRRFYWPERGETAADACETPMKIAALGYDDSRAEALAERDYTRDEPFASEVVATIDEQGVERVYDIEVRSEPVFRASQRR